MKTFLLAFLTVLYALGAGAQVTTITLDGRDSGRVFEGVGALSAGASSRLLADYPEPWRSDILDFLFKPGFGASLPQLKVETGGDVNSTDGAELSYAHTRGEFLEPQPGYFSRGYEWWLLREALNRNAALGTEILAWGAPGWVGDGTYYAPETAAYLAAYLQGLEKYHGIRVDYTGIRNEVMWDTAWIRLLRRSLDSAGLQRVRIDVGDQWKRDDQWKIATLMAADSGLAAVIDAINAHVPEETGFYTPPAVAASGKSVWSGESHAPGGDWYAAARMARINNRAYIQARITKVIYWSLISAYPYFLTAPGSGMMKAASPWSGHYELQPPLWMYAHVNQFARPGWRYLDQACRYFEREGWSVVALRDPASGDYSLVIETMDAKEPQTLHFRPAGGLSARPLAVWSSAFKQFLFERQPDLQPREGRFSITLQPNRVYSLTTTRGQHKGAPAHPIPAARPFPLPYADDFDRDSLWREPPYLINYHGAFEVRKDSAGHRYLQQGALRQGINWFRQPHPLLLIGDSAWTDTRLGVDVRLPDSGSAYLLARLHQFPWNSRLPGYRFGIDREGRWSLQRCAPDSVLAQGRAPALGDRWHRLELLAAGDTLEVRLDGRRLLRVRDGTYSAGVMALGSGWNEALFDRLRVDPEGRRP